mmetsp:Transcript_25872/g.77932  ORF Transcript_25872/g.77932 Transcript_25872/m.77932 type:complete len:206 (+) Transcript_25872:1380-1997(+)
MTTRGPWDLWRIDASYGNSVHNRGSTYETLDGERIAAVRIHQANGFVDGVQFRYRQPSPGEIRLYVFGRRCPHRPHKLVTDFLGPSAWFGTHGRSGGRFSGTTIPVTLTLEDGEDSVSVKLAFTDHVKTGVRSLQITTSTGRVVDSSMTQRRIRFVVPPGAPADAVLRTSAVLENGGAPLSGFREEIFVRNGRRTSFRMKSFLNL